ncbi:MAG: YggT family protein [Pseudomonadota bacterium]|nr:YggT family protein [Pseudomonadota bacterium]
MRIFAFLFLRRFVLQAVHADFYNPISSAIVRFTNPVLRVVRQVLPTYRNLDLASFGARLIAYTLADLTGIFSRGEIATIDWWTLIRVELYQTFDLLVSIFLFAIFILIALSWLVQFGIIHGSRSPATTLLNQICEPLLRPAKKLLPSVGMIDLSPMITIVILWIIQRWLLPGLLL